MFYTTVSPILPTLPNLSTEFAAQLLPTILSAVLFIGVSLLIGHIILAKMIATQGMKCRHSVILSLTGIYSIAVFLRYGLSVTAVQGIFLFFVLLYASCSDLTDHTVDDHVWDPPTIFLLRIRKPGRTIPGGFRESRHPNGSKRNGRVMHVLVRLDLLRPTAESGVNTLSVSRTKSKTGRPMLAVRAKDCNGSVPVQIHGEARHRGSGTEWGYSGRATLPAIRSQEFPALYNLRFQKAPHSKGISLPIE